MSKSIVPSLVNLPAELIYRILDCLDPSDILISFRNVCKYLDRIIHRYHRYQGNRATVDAKRSFNRFTEELRQMIVYRSRLQFESEQSNTFVDRHPMN